VTKRVGVSQVARRLTVLIGCAGVLAAGAAPSAQAASTSLVAGTGVVGYAGDGGPAVQALLNHPRGMAALPGGGFLIADAFADVVRRVGPDGIISTVAGTGTRGYGGDDGPATRAQLALPHAVAVIPGGGFLIADALNRRIRRVGADGVITTVAGTGVKGFSGDGGPATQAQIADPRGMAAFADGSFLIADTDNARVRFVSTAGVISTVAGNGLFSGTAPAMKGACQATGSAVAGQMRPYGVEPVPGSAAFLVTDYGDNCVRRVSSVVGGTISTVAGNGVAGFGGDGGPATAAQLDQPHNATVMHDGTVLIADTLNNRVRAVHADGTIQTAAGTGTAGAAGLGGPPTALQLNAPKAMLPYGTGYLIADAGNARVVLVSHSATHTG